MAEYGPTVAERPISPGRQRKDSSSSLQVMKALGVLPLLLQQAKMKQLPSPSVAMERLRPLS
jgi:hypothetical protein